MKSHEKQWQGYVAEFIESQLKVNSCKVERDELVPNLRVEFMALGYFEMLEIAQIMFEIHRRYEIRDMFVAAENNKVVLYVKC